MSHDLRNHCWIREVVEEWHNENVTSWKYLERHGLQGAEEFGNVIAVNCLGYDTIEELIRKLHIAKSEGELDNREGSLENPAVKAPIDIEESPQRTQEEK